MKLRISKTEIEKLTLELKKAESQEIGGILFGEQVAEADFRIVELTLQKRRGDELYFTRNASSALSALKCFNKKYGENHTHFNYLGEWHSHPNSQVVPSSIDISTMRKLLAESRKYCQLSLSLDCSP